MKIKTFEQYVNEDRNTLKAQDQTKAGLFQIESAVVDMLQSAKRNSIIEFFETDISPYNDGYELKIDMELTEQATRYRYDYDEEISELPLSIAFFSHHFSSFRYSFQPETFFGKILKEDGTAKLEFNMPVLKDAREKRFDTGHFREGVNDKSEIASTVRKYVERAKQLMSRIQQDVESDPLN